MENTFHKIDFSAYPRAAHYQHYTKTANCTYSITADLDITPLVQRCKSIGYKLTPALLYWCYLGVEQNREMRFMLNEEGELGYFDHLEPTYPIFHTDDETFTYLYTPVKAPFSAYYAAVEADKKRFSSLRGPVGIPAPAATFSISSIPWVSFTGFNLNILTDGSFFSPIMTFGKYRPVNGQLLLPFALQIHHAVADGYHAARFLNDLAGLALRPEEWID